MGCTLLNFFGSTHLVKSEWVILQSITAQNICYRHLEHYCAGLSLSFNSPVAFIFTPVANLLLYGWIVLTIGQFTCNIKSSSSVLSRNRCYRLWSLLTALLWTCLIEIWNWGDRWILHVAYFLQQFFTHLGGMETPGGTLKQSPDK